MITILILVISILLCDVFSNEIILPYVFSIKMLQSALFILYGILSLLILFTHNIYVHTDNVVEFVDLISRKRISIDSIKGFHSKKGLILFSGRKVKYFFPRLQYYPKKDFHEWIDKTFTKLD